MIILVRMSRAIVVLLLSCLLLVGPLSAIEVADPVGESEAFVIPPSLPQLNWSVLPDTSEDAPIYQKYIEATILDELPGVKYYKVERVTDMTGSALHSDDDYPMWFQNNPYMIHFEHNWGRTSKDQGIIYIRISGWSEKEKNGGQQITQNSTVVDIHYDHDYDYLGHTITAQVKGPAEVVLTATPNNATLAKQTMRWMWRREKPMVRNSVLQTDGKGWPKFEQDNSYDIPLTMRTKDLLISVTEPGIHYLKLYGSSSGLDPYRSHQGLNMGLYSQAAPKVNGTYQPFAIIVPYSNGTIPQTCTNFSGPSIVTPPIPGDIRFPLEKSDISIFSGGYVTYWTHDSRIEYVEIELPNYVKIWNNGYVNITSTLPLGEVPPGWSRYRYERPSPTSRTVSFTLEFDPEVYGGTTFTAQIRVFNELTNASLTTNWQTQRMLCVDLPEIQAPKRLITELGWQSNSAFRRTGLDNKTACLTILKELGFNHYYTSYGGEWTTPTTLDDRFYLPDERIGSEWEDMGYGPLYNVFHRGLYDGYAWETMMCGDTKLGRSKFDKTDLTNYGVAPEHVDDERQAWMDALDFYENHTGSIKDMAYRGVWYNRSVQHAYWFVNETQPDVIWVDSEFFPSFSGWRNKVNLSENANKRRLPGETDEDLALRMVDEFWGFFMENVTAACAKTKVCVYGSKPNYNGGYQAFPWSVFEKYGVIAQPSVYAMEKFLYNFTYHMRNAWLHADRSIYNIPVVSSGCYGEMPSEDMLDITIHTFCNGAKGIFTYQPLWNDDMRDYFDIGVGIGLISPYEDIIMDGELAYDDFSNVKNCVVSAMGHEGEYVMAVSPEEVSVGQTFDFTPANSTECYWVTDVRNGGDYYFNPGTFSMDLDLDDGTVFYVRSFVPTYPNLPLVVSSGSPANGTVDVALNTPLKVTLFDNETWGMNISWRSNVSGSWQEIGSNNGVADGEHVLNTTLFSDYNTTYYWGVECTDGIHWDNRTFEFTTIASDVVSIAEPYPIDQATGINISLDMLSVNITDPEGDPIDWSITTSPYIGSYSTTRSSGGVVSCSISGLEYNSTYFWTVSATDPTGSAVLIERTYSFSTEPEPVVVDPTPPPPMPITIVAIVPDEAHIGSEVEFSSVGTVSPNSTIVSYAWDLGDGTGSTDASLVHTYMELGEYYVTLDVEDALGQKATTTTMIKVTNYAPTIELETTNLSGRPGEKITLEFLVADADGDDTTVSIKWSDTGPVSEHVMDDGSELALDHSYPEAGEYTVTFYVVDEWDGASSVKTAMVLIEEEEMVVGGTGDPIPEVQDPPVETPETTEKEAGSLPFWLGLLALVVVIILVILIIVGVVIAVLVMRRGDEEEAVPEETEEAQEELADEEVGPEQGYDDLYGSTEEAIEDSASDEISYEEETTEFEYEDQHDIPSTDEDDAHILDDDELDNQDLVDELFEFD